MRSVSVRRGDRAAGRPRSLGLLGSSPLLLGEAQGRRCGGDSRWLGSIPAPAGEEGEGSLFVRRSGGSLVLFFGGLQGDLQQARYFFLDVDDGFCLLQASFEMAVLAFEFENAARVFRSAGESRRGCPALLRWSIEGSCGTLLAKSGEGGMGDVGALEEPAEFSGLCAGVGLLEDLEFEGVGIAITELGVAGNDLRIDGWTFWLRILVCLGSGHRNGFLSRPYCG